MYFVRILYYYYYYYYYNYPFEIQGTVFESQD